MSITFNKKIKPKSLVDMVPMIDIIFQLVIFFMVATTFKTTTGMELNLPESKIVKSISTIPIKIYIIDENNIKVDNIETNIANLKNVIKVKLIKDEKVRQSIVIYGNKNINYQLLINVMDILRLQGYNNIDLALKKEF
jgi:biopolymer transport protein ExbD